MLICLLSGKEKGEGAQIKAEAAQISILCLFISEVLWERLSEGYVTCLDVHLKCCVIDVSLNS